MTKSQTPANFPVEEDNTLDFGIVYKMVLGLDEDGVTPGVRIEFPPDINLPAIQFLIQPQMALSLVDQFQRLEKELGWKRAAPFLKN
jgi:hypothetical protein